MAPKDSKSCKICRNDFDDNYHQIVALPCSHSFCLTCLFRIKALDCPVCPKCRQNFKNFYLPRISNVTSLKDVEKHWEGYFKNAKMDTICKEHMFPYVFWNEHLKRLHCNKCLEVLSIEPGTLSLIEDNISSFRDDITRRSSDHLTNLNTENCKHQCMMDKSRHALESVELYHQNFKQLENDIQTRISRREKQINLAKKIEKWSHKIQTGQINLAEKIEKWSHKIQTGQINLAEKIEKQSHEIQSGQMNLAEKIEKKDQQIQSRCDVRSMVAYMCILDGLESAMSPPLRRQETPMSQCFPDCPPKNPDEMRNRFLAELLIDLKDAALSWSGLISALAFVVLSLSCFVYFISKCVTDGKPDI